MSLPFIELQKALYQRLTNDAVLSSLVTEVYDYISEDAKFPYIVIGEPRLRFENVKNSDIQEVTVTLHTWHNQAESGDYGNVKSYEILDAIYSALKYKLDVNDWEVVRTQPNEPKIFEDIDQITKHGVITYTFTLKRRKE